MSERNPTPYPRQEIVPVYVSVDYAIAPLVRELNAMPKLDLSASCQGWIDGHASYRPYVMVGFRTDDALAVLREAGYDVSDVHETWCLVHPKEPAK